MASARIIAVIKNPSQYGLIVNAKLASQMTVDYGNITDQLNRTVEEMTFIEATQYREIFVQRIESAFQSSAVITEMDKFVPLGEAKITANMENFSDYWMNTPLKTEIE